MTEQAKSSTRQDTNPSASTARFQASPSTGTVLTADKLKKKRKKNKSKQSLNKKKRELNNVRIIAEKERQDWADSIKKLKNEMKRAQPLIDDAPPKLLVNDIYDPDLLKGVRMGLISAFDANKNMVKTLYEMNFLPGKTETYRVPTNRPSSSNYSTRKKEALDIEKKNVYLSKVIKSVKPTMLTVKDYGIEWKKIEDQLESMSSYPLYWKVKKKAYDPIEVAPPNPSFQQLTTEKSLKYPDKRPRVFLEISIENIGVIGKLVAVLFSDYVPMTVKNFLAFCNPKAPLTYKGNCFFLVFQGYFCHTGDVVENQGYGGTSIYGPYFRNEDFTLKHGKRGVLTTYHKSPDRNDSQFLITFRKLESLDGENIVFGKIVKGFRVLETIESVGTRGTGRPKLNVFISDCDEI